MKIQAVLIAVAMVAAGGAFAASDTTTPTTDSGAKPGVTAGHKAKTQKTQHKSAHLGKTSHKADQHAKGSTHHKANQHAKASTHHKANQHAKASTHHMGANSHHMSESKAMPATDLSAGDRKNRIDSAYDKWKSNKG